MTVNLSAVGNQVTHNGVSWDSRDCALYALACGATFADASYLFSQDNNDLWVSPGFPLSLVSAVANRQADPLLGAGHFEGRPQLLASQSLVLHRPMPAEGTAQIKTTLRAIEDSGSAAWIVLHNVGICETTGISLFTAETVMHIAGEGGFGGPPAPVLGPRRRVSPWRKLKVPIKLSATQSLHYGIVAKDHHGIHVDPVASSLAGLKGPILTGHNLLGIVGQAISAVSSSSDEMPIHSISARFGRPAYNNEQLQIEIWHEHNIPDVDRELFGFRVLNEDGEEVIPWGECVSTASIGQLPLPQESQESGMKFRGYILRENSPALTGSIEMIDEAELPEGDVDVDIKFSSLNYKDGMVLNGLGKLVREYPHVPGIDFAGIVRSSRNPRFSAGDEVILTGWRVGEIHWGGFAERARVKADWLVSLPPSLSLKSSMAIGTAGLTAMLSLNALQRSGVEPGGRPILVTGGSGGVGGVAIVLLTAAGYEVHASTGRPELEEYLKRLGAKAIVDRADLAQTSRPLNAERWAGAVDSVGSQTLATILSQVEYGGSVAACGLAGGSDLPATVIPFLLRGISLLGIDSVMCPLGEREHAWSRIAQIVPEDLLNEITTVKGLSDLPSLGREILAGQTRGRTVIDLSL